MNNQKVLKQRYAEILAADVWRNDQSMIDFCLKKAGYIVELENGDIVVIDKPEIKKDFCFGYSDSRYDTEDYDRANACADHARNSVDYFIEQNMVEIDNMIALYEGKDADRWVFKVCIPYSGQPRDSKFKSIFMYRPWDESEYSKQFPVLGDADRQRMIEGYKAVRAAFEKRLNTYLKRYGLSKVHAWSYWQDA